MDMDQRIEALTDAINGIRSDARQRQALSVAAQVDAEVKSRLQNIRYPSIAAQIGPGPSLDDGSPPLAFVNPHPALKASFGPSYQSGTFLTALMDVHGDPDRFTVGKAILGALGTTYREAPEFAKATLGTTGATGGYVLPNNLVGPLVKPGVSTAPWESIIRVVSGVAVRGVDQPLRTGAPTRMLAQDWGASKTNISEAYGSYTATLATFAAIYDIGKQYARFSAGSAEVDVLDELTKARDLAVEFSILAGPGTGAATPGINDPTAGIYTQVAATGLYTTNHAPASASTIAGSAANGLQAGFKALASRSRRPSAVIMDSVTYWDMFEQGSDNAGFFMSTLIGAGFSGGGVGQPLTLRNVPIYDSPNFDSFTSTTKGALVIDGSAFRLYQGAEFRVDSSDVAGDRWDKNLIGFRGEAEWGFHAGTGVAVGGAQFISNLIP